MKKIQHLISTQNLSYKYPGGQLALDDISLTINEGDFVAVLGHNGSGKSTLAKQFNALITPTSGTVIINGMDTKDGELLFDIRGTVGMVFQNPDNQIVGTVVEEDVAFGPENLGIPREEIGIRVQEALQAVDMENYRQRAPHQLSGGQKQRVSVAGILAMRPRCIVLDEASSMLDPKGRVELMHTITGLNRRGTTIINITHFMEDAVRAKRVIIMKQGKVILDGAPGQVFSQRDILRDAGLDIPPVCKLASLLAEAGFDVDPAIIHEDDFIQTIENLLKCK